MSDHQIKLVRSLALSSATDGKSRLLASYFDSLDNDGWLIEVARTHVRLQAWATMTHQLWSEFLAMDNARKYRVTVMRPDSVRAQLTELARESLKYDGKDILTRLVRSGPYMVWARTYGVSRTEQIRRRGRRIESIDCANELASQIEELRLQTQMTLKKWAHKIGTSENTYRRRCFDGEVPTEWLTNARQAVASKLNDRRSKAERFEPVSDDELKEAMEVTWKSYETRSESLRAGEVAPPVELVNDPEVEVVDLAEPFEPSEEVELEDLEQ